VPAITGPVNRGFSPDSIGSVLEPALKALEEGREADALRLLLEAWRASKAPAIASAIDALSKRIDAMRNLVRPAPVKLDDKQWMPLAAKGDPVDVGLLLSTFLTHRSVEAAKRLEKLAAIAPDPRVSAAIAGWIATPPYQARTTVPFWKKAFERLIALDDPATIPPLTAARAGFEKTLASSEWARTWFGKQVDHALETLHARWPRTPSVGEADSMHLLKILGRATSPVEGTARAASLVTDREKKNRDFLEKIYADPADDALRQVYADWLVEQGNPRGEFINLQFQRLRDGKGKPGRERTLLDEHWREWLDGVQFQKKELLFERGFVESGSLNGVLPASPAWATVKSVIVESPWTPPIGELLSSPLLRSLETVRGVGADGIVPATSPIRATRVAFRSARLWPALREAVERLPNLRHLELLHLGSIPIPMGPDPLVADVVGWVLDALVPRLETFTVEQQAALWSAELAPGPAPVVTIELRAMRQDGWRRLIELLPLFVPLRPKLRVRGQTFDVSQRAYVEKNLASFAPSGLEIA
jgi:uncharacterized protein (TIGR02996 family)